MLNVKCCLLKRRRGCWKKLKLLVAASTQGQLRGYRISSKLKCGQEHQTAGGGWRVAGGGLRCAQLPVMTSVNKGFYRDMISLKSRPHSSTNWAVFRSLQNHCCCNLPGTGRALGGLCMYSVFHRQVPTRKSSAPQGEGCCTLLVLATRGGMWRKTRRFWIDAWKGKQNNTEVLGAQLSQKKISVRQPL